MSPLGHLFEEKISIDLGTANTRLYVPRKELVISEPSVVALARADKAQSEILAVGKRAKDMLGRTPPNIVAVRPMRDGVIADFEATRALLSYFLTLGRSKPRLRKPLVVVGVPSGVTPVERRAVVEATTAAGAGQVLLYPQPLLAAIGASLPVTAASGSMILDVGGGTSDIAVVALGGIVCGRSIRVAGDVFDESIISHVKRTHNLLIGERTAEEIKMMIGCAMPSAEDSSMEIRGLDMAHGLPRSVTITSSEVFRSIANNVSDVIEAIRAVLDKTLPELSADLTEKGIVLTGGGAMLKGFSERLRQETGLPVSVAEDPINAVVLGGGKILTDAGLRGQVASFDGNE